MADGARLARERAHGARDNATPLVLVAISHDACAGDVPVDRTEDGPADADRGALLRAIGHRLCPAAGREAEGSGP